MSSRLDDELWSLVPHPGGAPPRVLSDFVSSLDPAVAALDLGCGDGRLSGFIPAERLTLADVSAVALSRAAERLPAAHTLELEPDAPLPVPDNAMDLVVCAETLEHVRTCSCCSPRCAGCCAPAAGSR